MFAFIYILLQQREFGRKARAEELQSAAGGPDAAVFRSVPGELLGPLRHLPSVCRGETSRPARPHVVQSLQHTMEVRVASSFVLTRVFLLLWWSQVAWLDFTRDAAGTSGCGCRWSTRISRRAPRLLSPCGTYMDLAEPFLSGEPQSHCLANMGESSLAQFRRTNSSSWRFYILNHKIPSQMTSFFYLCQSVLE